MLVSRVFMKDTATHLYGSTAILHIRRKLDPASHLVRHLLSVRFQDPNSASVFLIFGPSKRRVNFIVLVFASPSTVLVLEEYATEAPDLICESVLVRWI